MTDIDFCTYFDQLPITPLAHEEHETVLEDAGTIMVVHGFAGAGLDTGSFIRAEQTAGLPPYATHATVFLNGWRLGYRSGDHHVEGLGAFIRNIRYGRSELSWDTVGVLADNDHDEPYTLTYHYTVIAWNSSRLNAVVDHDDAPDACTTNQPGLNDNFFWTRNRDTTTALSVFPTFLFGHPSLGQTAVHPRGFGFGWGTDHHLLQFAYNLDFAETLLQDQHYKKALGVLNPRPVPADGLVDSGYVSWNSYVIVKDDERRRDYFFGELASALAGRDVKAIQPPFFILPFEGSSGALGGAGVKSKEVVIESIPFAYAIPMLTGWDIGYTAGDQHVREIGIWIDSFQYEWTPGSPAGRLRYKVSSILRDKNTWPDNYFRHKVTVLCLRAAPTRGTAPEP